MLRKNLTILAAPLRFYISLNQWIRLEILDLLYIICQTSKVDKTCWEQL